MPVLASAWQQRRNARAGFWGIGLVAALCMAAPVVLGVWSLLCDPVLAGALRRAMGVSACTGAAALVFAGWAMLVGNVLQQNQPALARLVPGHVGRLRGSLLSAWVIAMLAAAAGPGFVIGAPLAWACGMAAALALLTAALRWPLLWLLGIVAPLAVRGVLAWFDSDDIDVALWTAWARHGWLIMAVVATAGAVVLASVVRAGGRDHLAAYEAGRTVARCLGLCGRAPAVTAAALPAVASLRAIASRPYDWWLARILARGDSPVQARLQLGLGPSLHWTSRLGDIFWTIVLGGVALAVFAAWTSVEVRATIIAWASFSALLTLGVSPSQAPSRLRKSQREQALLLLLPGAPRGAALGRWLGWRLTAQSLLATCAGLLLSWALAGHAEATWPGASMAALGGIGPIYATTLLPMLATLWRRWSRLPSASTFDQVPPLFVQGALGVLAFAVHLATGAGYGVIGAAYAVATLAWCARRWQRLADEPAALPVGRLA